MSYLFSQVANMSDPEDTLGGLTIGTADDSAPQERMALSRDELLKQLTAQFQMCVGCEEVSVVSVTRLDTPDAQGCNWSSSVVLATGGVPPEVYGLAYASVIASARNTWNFK